MEFFLVLFQKKPKQLKFCCKTEIPKSKIVLVYTENKVCQAFNFFLFMTAEGEAIAHNF